MGAERRIEAGEAEAFLRRRYDDPGLAVAPLAGGTWSRAFVFRHDGADLVARFGRHPDDYRKDERAAGWSSPALPIPTVLEVLPVADGSWCAVSTRAHGLPLESMSPTGWTALVPQVVKLIARCAALPSDPSLGLGRWRPDGTAPHTSWREVLLDVTGDGPDHRIQGWQAALATHPAAQEAFDDGLAALDRLSADLAPRIGVVHADLLNANVPVDGRRITAVLDWGSSLYGDPLYDVAWIAFWAPWHPNLSGPAFLDAALADERLTAGGDVDRRLRACRLHIGLGHLAYHAWAGGGPELDRLVPAVLADADS